MEILVVKSSVFNKMKEVSHFQEFDGNVHKVIKVIEDVQEFEDCYANCLYVKTDKGKETLFINEKTIKDKKL
ncbi:MAG: hypothetical protein ACOC56_05140 [Atribacterota bacterium]